MSKPAAVQKLNELHAAVADVFITRLEQDKKDDLPTDAATLSAAIRFLKDNNISADPASTDDLQEMRDLMAEQAEKRRARQQATREALEKAQRQAMETLNHGH